MGNNLVVHQVDLINLLQHIQKGNEVFNISFNSVFAFYILMFFIAVITRFSFFLNSTRADIIYIATVNFLSQVFSVNLVSIDKAFVTLYVMFCIKKASWSAEFRDDIHLINFQTTGKSNGKRVS